MKLYGQEVEETDTHIRFDLREPFWGAWKIYKWINREVGFGIGIGILQYAYRKHKKISLSYNQMTYEISPVTINNFYKVSEPKPIHYARNDVKIVVIPQSKFDRVKEEIKIETNKVVEEEQQSLL